MAEKRYRTPKANPKIRCTFRLDKVVLEIIRSQPNQAKFIEKIVNDYVTLTNRFNS